MAPKSLLRHKRAVSSLSDMETGSTFHRVMPDGAEAGCDVGGVKLQPDDKITRGGDVLGQGLFRPGRGAGQARA